jgi:hypothetical protein
MANRKKWNRQRIDTMIDAHVWMRRQARFRGEWNGDGLRAPQKKFCPLSGRCQRTRQRLLQTITLSYLQKETTPHPQRKIHPGYCNAAS